ADRRCKSSRSRRRQFPSPVSAGKNWRREPWPGRALPCRRKCACRPGRQTFQKEARALPKQAPQFRDWARRSSLLRGEIALERGLHELDEGLRKESEPDRNRDQQSDRNAEAPAEIGDRAARFTHRTHEDRAVSSQHVNGGDDDAPKSEDGGPLIEVEPFRIRAVPECAEKHHHFAGEIREARKPDRSECRQAKRESSQRHELAEPAQIG